MKEGKEKALRAGPDFENDVLMAAELELLYSQTNVACAYQAQRYDMIIMGFRTCSLTLLTLLLHNAFVRGAMFSSPIEQIAAS
jgi:hypothetical protein